MSKFIPRLRPDADWLMTFLLCADTTGPPDSKYCADGGVYYTYNFVERPNGGGGVGWPWGADKLQPQAGIELKVNLFS